MAFERIFAGFARPLLFAHRGASALAPENTLESFELAARLGAQILEMDVHATVDGEVVVLHDALLDRTTDGSGPVRQCTWRDIASLDAGCRFVTRDGQRPFKNRGLVVPRLIDVLRSFPRCGFNIEIKAPDEALVRGVLAALEQAAVAADAVVLAAGQEAVMTLLERCQPGCALGLSARQAQAVVRGCYTGRIAQPYHGRALQIPPFYRGLPLSTGRVIRQARAVNIPVHLWTINSPREARKWLARGVDGLMSDNPGALTELFAHYRAASAPARAVV